MSGLMGKRIAVTGARKGQEISQLIENLKGIPYIRPTQGTMFLEEEQVAPDLERLLQKGTDWIILTTGIGTQAMVELADKLGRREDLLRLLQNVKIAARGYKTRKYLKELGIKHTLTDDDGSLRGLIRAFADIDLRGQRVALQLYGEMPGALAQWLESTGAIYSEVMPYTHVPPPADDVAAFITEIREGKFDAVSFTAAMQVYYLFEAAKRAGVQNDLLRIFAGPTVAVAVGIVTAEALQDAGVTRIVQPSNQRMGGMIVELDRYFSRRDD